jgi:cation:H+ antiporter
MLSTLAFFLVGLTVSLSAVRKKRRFELKVETLSLRRDLSFFLTMYCLAVIAPLFMGRAVRTPIAVLLVAGYLFYIRMTFRGESADMEHAEEVYIWLFAKRFTRLTIAKAPAALILVQVAASLTVMIKGAHIFVESLGWISARFGMNPLLFSLLLAPFATELPEKFNSVTWILKGRDTLAVGNITGAMVFQATFPVSVGLLFTEWNISGMALLSALLAIFSGATVLAAILIKKRVPPLLMIIPGFLYLIYLATVILTYGHATN